MNDEQSPARHEFRFRDDGTAMRFLRGEAVGFGDGRLFRMGRRAKAVIQGGTVTVIGDVETTWLECELAPSDRV